MAVDHPVQLSRFDPSSIENDLFIAKTYIDANHLRRAIEAVEAIVLEYERQLRPSTKQCEQHETIVVLLLEALTRLKMRQQRFTDADLLPVGLRGRSITA